MIYDDMLKNLASIAEKLKSKRQCICLHEHARVRKSPAPNHHPVQIRRSVRGVELHPGFLHVQNSTIKREVTIREFMAESYHPVVHSANSMDHKQSKHGNAK